MNVIIVILSISLVILVILCIYFIYNSVNSSANLINPLDCPKQRGEFGVFPNSIGLQPINRCGPNEDEPCLFTNVGSLFDAVEICRQNSTICTAFSYTPASTPQPDGSFANSMSIIEYSGGVTESATTDTYVSQINVTVT
jgi:hypothetical protein